MTLDATLAAAHDPVARTGLLQALWGLGWTLRERSVVPERVERMVRLVEESPPAPAPTARRPQRFHPAAGHPR